MAAAAVLVLASVAACGEEGGPPAEVVTAPPATTDPTAATELASHDGEPCPQRLPPADEETHGWGTDDAATESPTLPVADEAWVCTYAPREADRRADGDVVLRWERTEEPAALDREELRRAEAALDGLAPAQREEVACTADLGPRWMLVLSDDGDLTGVVVDDYGCRDVRLTPEPHTVVPGTGGGGTVAGVLDGGPAVLRALGVGRGVR